MTASARRLLFGGLIIALAGTFGVASFRKSLTPYVSFAEARASGRMVQVKGFPDHANARFDQERQAFCFTLTDETGGALTVQYRGAKPGNFEQAESVVAIGRFQNGVLESTQLLVKCPSKYESNGSGAAEHPAGIPMRRGARLDPGPAGDGAGGAAAPAAPVKVPPASGG